jgi:hypothetical protein
MIMTISVNFTDASYLCQSLHILHVNMVLSSQNAQYFHALVLPN